MITLSAWGEETLQKLPCRVLLPDPFEPQLRRYPLVVSLHGSGERGTDNVSQLKNGLELFERTRQSQPCIVVAPQLRRNETFGGSWYGGETLGQRRLAALVEELRGRAAVDPSRVYAVGFSMGAIGLWDLLIRRPGLFSAAIPIAGDLDVEHAAPLVSFPLWSIIGGRDQSVPPDNTRAFARLVEARGGIAKVTEVPNADHGVWRDAFEHAPLWDWLFAQVAPAC